MNWRNPTFDRERPTDAFIENVRRKFPVEPEIDRILTNKLLRRVKGPFARPSLDELVDGTKRLIEADLGYQVDITDAQFLSGGASKLQVIFSLGWRGESGELDHHESSRMVLRLEPAASVTESSRVREFEVLKAVQGVIPAPKAYWLDAKAEYLPYPGIVYSFCQGVAKPSADPGKVSGLGQNYGVELRQKLKPDFVEMLAAIHTLDPSRFAQLTSFEVPQLGSNEAAIMQVNALRRIWEEDRLEDEPMLELVYQWLLQNAPATDYVSLVHGDYRNGNFLFDEEAGEITAWLDWEGAVLGDRHRDLTYATMRSFAHLSEDNKTVLASGIMPIDALFEAYEKASGLSVDMNRIHYYTIFNMYLLVVLILGAAARCAVGAKTHQDVLLNYLTGVGYPSMSEMMDYFERHAA